MKKINPLNYYEVIKEPNLEDIPEEFHSYIVDNSVNKTLETKK